MLVAISAACTAGQWWLSGAVVLSVCRSTASRRQRWASGGYHALVVLALVTTKVAFDHDLGTLLVGDYCSINPQHSSCG
jgi:hypothetical protein